ncbi:hypothetical protein [Allobranchiibius huperziae]|uniref:Uncharacterized protein n=1 Tax=Allobranchiibius huperziae TaxID=1874116 RepID=A0A853DNA7_9MICO|nr:hypothetical protein [Allobranchiibius huperziae]NYJ75625.1 hypothetical protein [Allobranchiibius huperziae]
MNEILKVAITALIGSALSALLAPLLRRMRWTRLEAALRFPGQRWQHGQLTVGPGVLRFQPYRGQFRLRQGSTHDLHVLSFSRAPHRSPGRRTIWSLNPRTQIVDLSTTNGQLELAAVPRTLRLIMDQLEPRG